MPSASSDSGSGSDSDAPELYSLAASKESEKLKSEEIEKVQAALRRQTKRKNQERDRVLKEQAQRRKETVSAIEARMERAMEEAQEEDSESSEWGGIGAEPVPEMDDDEDMEVVQNGPHEQTSDEGNCGLNYGAESSGSVMPKSINRLPDHLFEAAFASQKAQLEASTSTIQNPTKSESVASASARGKKMIRKTQPKDVVIGYEPFFNPSRRPILNTSSIKVTNH
ncbi:hypothetical protein APHAL10511_000334 [Amanita phalloides]|nr:hypothetical protein APHAL10511_000334 [Amanita phalloides]